MVQTLPPAVILAGGMASRMGGGDKPLIIVGGHPLVDWIVGRLKRQSGPIAISANGDPRRFALVTYPVLPDTRQGMGPLGGVLSAMKWAATMASPPSHVLVVAGDTPFLPSDLVQRLLEATNGRKDTIIVASSDGQLHPTIALWPLTMLVHVANALDGDKPRRLTHWLDRLGCHSVEWSSDPFDPFFNINTPDELEQAEALVALNKLKPFS
jgi:molybdopterin-guanine dinucleotide biosynthesis protein A